MHLKSNQIVEQVAGELAGLIATDGAKLSRTHIRRERRFRSLEELWELLRPKLPNMRPRWAVKRARLGDPVRQRDVCCILA
jgi:hypothetical protein